MDCGVDVVQDVRADCNVSLSSYPITTTSLRCQNNLLLSPRRHPQNLPRRRRPRFLQRVPSLYPTPLISPSVVASVIRVLPGTIITFLVYENINRAFETAA